jgi:hypothetical protein
VFINPLLATTIEIGDSGEPNPLAAATNLSHSSGLTCPEPGSSGYVDPTFWRDVALPLALGRCAVD